MKIFQLNALDQSAYREYNSTTLTVFAALFAWQNNNELLQVIYQPTMICSCKLFAKSQEGACHDWKQR